MPAHRSRSKAPSDHQFYIVQPEFSAKVMAMYKKDRADTVKKDHLNVQCQIVHTLLEGKSEEVKHRIRAEATAEHEALMKAHNSAVKGLPSMDKEEQKM
jgi:hypothetical protein